MISMFNFTKESDSAYYIPGRTAGCITWKSSQLIHR